MISMKRIFLVIGLCMHGMLLMAGSQYVYNCNGLEPSAINLAMGGSPIAAVNYWHRDPMTSYGNPAFTALHEGNR